MMSEQGRRIPIRQKLLLGLAALVVAGVFICAILAYRYEFQLAPLWYDVVGVDVSNHQGEIDWPALAGSKVAFAYIKATEGGDFRDKRFQLNWEGAKGAGWRVEPTTSSHNADRATSRPRILLR
jgi:lysozyme